MPHQILQTVAADDKSTKQNDKERTLPLLRELRLVLPRSYRSIEALGHWLSQDGRLVPPIVDEGSIDGTEQQCRAG